MPPKPSTSPNFAQVAVVLQTAAGDIGIQVFPQLAALSAGSFLDYVDRGLFDGAAFYRVVRKDNDKGWPVIEVIQGGLVAETAPLPDVAHETTKLSGIRHTDGTVSLARFAPGTGNGAAFFVTLGRQPALDFGGQRNPDGLGFAAFGNVTAGMEVVRNIQQMHANGPSELDYTKGQILTRPVVIARAFRKEPT